MEVDLLRGHESDPERLESLPTATVASLLHLRQSEVLQYIQSNGMHKLAEFDLEVGGRYPSLSVLFKIHVVEDSSRPKWPGGGLFRDRKSHSVDPAGRSRVFGLQGRAHVDVRLR